MTRDRSKSPSFVITAVDVKREERGEGMRGGSGDGGERGKEMGER